MAKYQIILLSILTVMIVFLMVNYEDAFAEPTEIVFQDDFNDNFLDLSNWIEFDSLGDLAEVNNHIEIEINVANDTDSSITTIPEISTGKVTAQAFLSLSPLFLQNQIRFSIGLNTIIKIGDDGTDTIFVQDPTQGFVSTGISLAGGKDVKMEYDIDTFDLNYYYWNGSTWVNIFSINFDLTGFLPAKIKLLGITQGNGDSLAIIDDVFLTQGFYTTHFPEITTPAPTSPPRTGGGGTTYADILESRAKQAIQNEISPTQVTEQSPLENLVQTLNTDLQLQSFLPNQNLGITLPFAPTILNLVISTGAIAGIGFILLKAWKKI